MDNKMSIDIYNGMIETITKDLKRLNMVLINNELKLVNVKSKIAGAEAELKYYTDLNTALQEQETGQENGQKPKHEPIHEQEPKHAQELKPGQEHARFKVGDRVMVKLYTSFGCDGDTGDIILIETDNDIIYYYVKLFNLTYGTVRVSENDIFNYYPGVANYPKIGETVQIRNRKSIGKYAGLTGQLVDKIDKITHTEYAIRVFGTTIYLKDDDFFII